MSVITKEVQVVDTKEAFKAIGHNAKVISKVAGKATWAWMRNVSKAVVGEPVVDFMTETEYMMEEINNA